MTFPGEFHLKRTPTPNFGLFLPDPLNSLCLSQHRWQCFCWEKLGRKLVGFPCMSQGFPPSSKRYLNGSFLDNLISVFSFCGDGWENPTSISSNSLLCEWTSTFCRKNWLRISQTASFTYFLTVVSPFWSSLSNFTASNNETQISLLGSLLNFISFKFCFPHNSRTRLWYVFCHYITWVLFPLISRNIFLISCYTFTRKAISICISVYSLSHSRHFSIMLFKILLASSHCPIPRPLPHL